MHIIDFSVEVRGSDRGTFVVFRRSFHGHGFPSYMALPRQVPRLVVAMARAKVLSVATSVASTMATHEITTATATAYSIANPMP